MSATATTADPHLVIERWCNTFVTARASPKREAAISDVARRIERSIHEDFPASCALRLGRSFGSGTTGLWLIRQLQVNFFVDIAKPGAGDISAEWSDRFSALLAELIGRGPDSDEGVLYFTSRAAYLAQFALDLIAGRAWSKWYYEEFRSLAMLSTSRAIAEVVSREPEEGAKAIVHLARIERLNEVLPLLSAVDAQMIYHCCFRGSTGDSSASASLSSRRLAELPIPVSSCSELDLWIGRLLEVWNEEPIRPSGGMVQTSFHEALRWLALVAARSPGVELDPVSCFAVESLIELRRVLEELQSPIVADRMVRGLVENKINLAEAIETASRQGSASPAKALRFLLAAAQGDADWAVQAAGVLLKDRLPPAQAIVARESMISAFAGIFLLGPALVRLNEVLEVIAGDGEEAKEIAGFLRYLVLIKTAGVKRTFEATGDPALRLLTGCHRWQLQDWQRACPAIDLERAGALLLRDLPAFAGCDIDCLLAEIIPAPDHAKEVLLLREFARNEWIHAQALEPQTGAREHALIAALSLIGESTGRLPAVLLHPSVSELAQSPKLHQFADRVVALDSADTNSGHALLSSCIAAPVSPEKYAQLVCSSGQEFSYFSFTTRWPDFDLALDLFGILLSRAALREFARHLLGFQTSSPEHLYSNFLEGIGTVRQQPGRIETELPRSPLLLVLQLSGLTRQTYTLPWLEGNEVCLLPPKE